MSIWMLVAGLAALDALLLAGWLHERKSHTKSRRALLYWRQRAGTTTVGPVGMKSKQGAA